MCFLIFCNRTDDKSKNTLNQKILQNSYEKRGNMSVIFYGKTGQYIKRLC